MSPDQTTYPDYNMDDLAGMQDNYEEVVEGQKSLMLPRGLYNTIPELSLRFTHDRTGRKVFRFTANVEGYHSQKPDDQGAVGKKGITFFGISPIPKYREDGKADGPWKLWIQARNLYADTHGLDRKEKGIDVPSVLKYIQEYPVALFLTQGDDSNFVNSISPVKE